MRILPMELLKPFLSSTLRRSSDLAYLHGRYLSALRSVGSRPTRRVNSLDTKAASRSRAWNMTWSILRRA